MSQSNSVFIVELCDSESGSVIVGECCFTSRQEATTFKNLQVDRIRNRCDVIELALFNTAREVPQEFYNYPDQPAKPISEKK